MDNQSPLRNFVLSGIQERGRRWGAPTVTFPGRTIWVQGEDIDVRGGLLYPLSGTSGFYLALPANAFGVVTTPDGVSVNMEGGLHEAPPGLYKLQYVDRHERLETLPPVSEMSTDGEKITLTVILRYQVIDPIMALGIDTPIETLLQHVETDVAQYIRTHAHTDIADSSGHHEDSTLLAFFTQRHSRRLPLSNAFAITGIEIKDFTGDDEYLEMRRKASMDLTKSRFEKEQAVFQQEVAKLKTAHKAEIEKLEAEHQKEKQGILDEIALREIDVNNKRAQMQWLSSGFNEILDALSRQVASGGTINPTMMKAMMDLFAAYKEEIDGGGQAASPTRPVPPARGEQAPRPTPPSGAGSDKVEKLKNTFLNLLNPKK